MTVWQKCHMIWSQSYRNRYFHWVFEVVRREQSTDTCPAVLSETKKYRPWYRQQWSCAFLAKMLLKSIWCLHPFLSDPFSSGRHVEEKIMVQICTSYHHPTRIVNLICLHKNGNVKTSSECHTTIRITALFTNFYHAITQPSHNIILIKVDERLRAPSCKEHLHVTQGQHT